MTWYRRAPWLLFLCSVMILSACRTQKEVRQDLDSKTYYILQSMDTLLYSDVTVTTVDFPVIRDSVRVRDSVVIRTIRNVQSTQMHTQKDTTTTISKKVQTKRKAHKQKPVSGWGDVLKFSFYFSILVMVILGFTWAFRKYFMIQK